MIRIGVRNIAARLGIAVALFSALLAPGLALGLAPGEAIAQEAAQEATSDKTAPPSDASDFGFDGIPPLVSTEAFASRIPFWGFGLSPDGTALSVFFRDDGQLKMGVYDPATNAPINMINFSAGATVDWSRWVDKDRMLIKAGNYVQGRRVSGRATVILLAWPREGRAIALTSSAAGFDAGDLLHVAKDKKSVLIAHGPPGKSSWGRKGLFRLFLNYEPRVYRYELKENGRVFRVLKPKTGVDTWVTDNSGVVRLGLGWRKKRLSIYYRDRKAEDFRRVARIKPGDDESYFEARELIYGTSQGYVLDENEEGRVGLRVFDYETREIVSTFWEHPEWDVEDAWLDDDGQPLAVFYTDDKQRVEWFDKDYKATYARLKSALPGDDLWIRARSDNGRQMLVVAGNEADPGSLYFYNANDGSLHEFAEFRPRIDFRFMTRPTALSYTARDGTKIRAYLTLPKGREPENLPLIIHPHGGPFGIRDELRYDDQVQFLANRGYAVLQPNFRGSGGYGTDFYELGTGEVGRGMQNDLDDAMDWAVAQGIADPRRVCIVGGSYGGYAALWGVVRNPKRYRCAASWAGVTDWARMLKYDRGVLSRQAGKRWTAQIEGEDEEIDLDDVSPYRLAAKLNRPVLLAHGTLDDNVPFQQYEWMRKAAKKAPVKLTTLVIEGEGHSFSRATSEQKWYDALDAFLAEHNPADQAGLPAAPKFRGKDARGDTKVADAEPDQASPEAGAEQ
ncbi:MAG: prolyl oligopeptidase family serine peptidase [Pseudomonadota bacterium]